MSIITEKPGVNDLLEDISITGFNFPSSPLIIRVDSMFHAADAVPRKSARDGGHCVASGWFFWTVLLTQQNSTDKQCPLSGISLCWRDLSEKPD